MCDRFEGALIGTAIGDALGLPAEGLGPDVIARRFGALDRYELVGRRGYVSDDTEQSALVATALARSAGDRERAVACFRRSMLGWVARLPFGVGFTTLRACLRIAIGLRRSGVHGAGNGAAMRSAIIGLFFVDDEVRRREHARALAEVTHTDPRAVDAAVFVAELAATTALGRVDRATAVDVARRVVRDPTLDFALARASVLAADGVDTAAAAAELGTTGYAVHSVPFAAYVYLRSGHAPMAAIREAIRAGGDTDTNAAIVGALVGATHGARAFPDAAVRSLHDGPFGPTHLRSLAQALSEARAGRPRHVAFSATHALLRNLALYPVVLAHGLARLVPFR